MKKLIFSTITSSCLLFSNLNAGVALDIDVGVGSWLAKTSGNINYEGGDIDLNKDLGLDDTSNTYFYADINHFVPILPNIRFERQELKTNGSKVTNVTFGGKSFSAGETNTDANLTQNDLIFYWGIPALNLATAGILNIDLGLNIKQYDGYIQLKNDTVNQNEKVDLDFIVPMGYLAVQIEPPFMPVTLSASTKMISYEGSSLSDSMVKASIDLPLPLEIVEFKLDLGYKLQKLDVSKDLSDDVNGDIKNDGFIVGLSAKF